MTHPHDEMLAAFIDGQLDDDARRRVVEHLVECAECRDVVLMADEVAVEMAEVPADADADNVVRPSFWNRWGMPLAAAASLVLVLFLGRDQITNQLDGGMTEVRKDYAQLEQRNLKSRLRGFEYKPPKPDLRGPGDDDSPAMLSLQAQQAELANKKGSRSWRESRALAAASLLVGDRDAAVAAIEEAEKLAPNEPAVINDLAAVYIEHSRYGGDADRAVAAAERAWKLDRTPESVWNRAKAYEEAGRRAEAIRAWQEYLDIDPDSQWSKEARVYLGRLQDVP